MKEKLSGIGSTLFFLLCLFIGVIPVVAIGLPWWGDLIIILIIQFIPATSAIFWIWGLIVTIGGPQDIFAIIYYVLFVVAFLPFIASTVLNLFGSVFNLFRK